MTTSSVASTPQQKRVKKSQPSSGLKQSSILSFFSKAKSSPVASSTQKEVPSSPVTTPLKFHAEKVEQRQVEEPEIPETSDLIQPESELPSSPQPLDRSTRRVNYAEDSSDDEDAPVLKKRKKRTIVDDEDDFVPEKIEEEPESDFGADDDFIDDDEDELITLTQRPTTKDSVAPVAKKQSPKKNAPARKIMTPVKTPARPSVKTPTTLLNKNQKFNKDNEERYQWLINEKDAEGRSPQDPEYDPSSLYIPQSAWGKFTPFEKQYWEIKSKMWDCIVFFKKGKFFELYEKDAHLAHSLFDLKIAGGGRANMQLAGIPEMSFDHWARQFINAGYKVAKVEQKESMLAKEMREGAPSKGKEVIQRELKCVLTAGTLTEGLINDMSTYCMAVKQDGNVFGVAFIDTSTGELQLHQWTDDDDYSQLETIMSQVKPKEIVLEKGQISSLALKIIKFNAAPEPIVNMNKSFNDFDTTFDDISNGKYFEDYNKWPALLTQYYEKEEKLGFMAFGGLLSYLKWLKLDQELISMGNIQQYSPIRSATSLVLDGITLQNLEIFANSEGGDRGTLFRLLNRCVTPFGKRLLQRWVMHPLLHRSDIEHRQQSVEQLLQDADLSDFIESTFKKLPDLERLLARIHSGSLKIKDFTKVIGSLEEIVSFFAKLQNYELKGSLKDCRVPESLGSAVEEWSNAFDRRAALDEGIIAPFPGVEPDFDESKDAIVQLEEQLNSYLREYKKEFKTQNMQFKDFGKELYTIEIPIAIKVPSNWTQMAANKTYKRWYSPEVQKLAKQMAMAKERHKLIEESLKSRLYSKFDKKYSLWMETITLISQIDCVLSLAKVSESLGDAVKPEFVDNEDGELTFTQLRHPCFNMGLSKSVDFIPNDITLGGAHAKMGLLTGANAAGKSTVLRMTGIAVIMAQLGCYVPCSYARLTPVDRIMTRLGANDNIMQGKSTFYVELSETKRILDFATNKSLLVIDELGRGGSSSDGFAIAESVLHHVATHIQSMGFFATHYGTLGLSFTNHPQVRPLKMDIIVDNASRDITFLYKLVDGKSEGSFGMHVATMCGIESKIVDDAEEAAQNLEHTSKLLKQHDHSTMIPLGLQSDAITLARDGFKGAGEGILVYDEHVQKAALNSIFAMIEGL